MLQSSMCSQLARLKFYFLLGGKRTIMSICKLGPMTSFLNAAANEIEVSKNFNNHHWICKGKRSLAIAVTLLQQNEIIAIPTDTIYGLAGIVSSTSSIEKLYEIKNRDKDKPLSISISNVNDIKKWGVVDHLPQDLLPLILPGPITIILKRTPALNPALNPNHDTVGIRIPYFKFINCISAIVGPLALTSANLSNEASCLYASEFENLWPMLGGIFYDSTKFGKSHSKLRKGSTIVDLSKPGYYKIVRAGVRVNGICSILTKFGLQKCFN
ncbi:threonylcarbamoyl-AMP synthase [Apis cerana]|nr:threonylcarbamoyl-AMP synthase [Apis cerana]